MYARLAIYHVSDLIKRVKADEISYEGLMDEKVFAFVCAGIAKSDFAAPKLQKYYADQLVSVANIQPKPATRDD
jgi:hypothetical protein